MLTKSVTIIVPTYRDGDALDACVRSLLAQDYPAGLLSIIVVNNDPIDPIGPFDPRVTVLAEARPGSYAARNAGLAVASGDVVAFTDADCIADPDWIAAAVGLLDSSGADRVAGEVVVFKATGDPTVAEMYEVATAFNQRRNAQNGVSVTANLVVKRVVFEDVGQFDAGLMSGGDIEWNQRASRAGRSIVYGKQAVVRHPARATIRELKRKARRVAGGRMSMKSRRALKLIRLAFPSLGVLGDIVRAPSVPVGYKPIVLLLALYLRLHAFWCGALIFVGLAQPQRR